MSVGELDVIDFVVNKGNGVKSLSDLSLASVPPQYVIPVCERLAGQLNTNTTIAIPIIDVSNWDTVEEQICQAAREWGFFQIINHGIPAEVLDNVLNAGHDFFGLPVEERKRYFFLEADSDDTCRLKTSFAPHKEKVLNWKDSLNHFYCIEEGKDHPKGFLRWPPVSRNQVLEYVECVKPVISKLLKVLMKGLNINEQILEDTEKSLTGILTVNLTYYPKCPNPDLTDGVRPHADVSAITVLLQDNTGGLYVHGKEENIWIPVEPVKGALVINIGDVLQIMSNDRYHSVEHRVSTNSRKHRVSVPLFVGPAPDTVVGILNQVLEIGENPLYKPMTYSEYLKYFFSKPQDGKQTIEYAKI